MPRNTTNLNLRVWNALSDTFNHAELAANWDKVDADDHSTHPLGPSGLASASVVQSKIADGAIVRSKIGAGAVGGTELASSVVAATHLADGAVGSRAFKPTAGVARANSTLVLNSSSTLLPGASVSLSVGVASAVIVNAAFVVAFGTSGDAFFTGGLRVNGTIRNSTAQFYNSSAGGRTITVGQTWYVPVTTLNTPILFELVGTKGSSVATATTQVDSGFTYLVAST